MTEDRVLVTVGSASFPKLITACSAWEGNIQVQWGTGAPCKRHPGFSFSSNFDDHLNRADVVVSHAGAGTVFTLLQLNKAFVVVPNVERFDQHQIDLAQYLREEKLCAVYDVYSFAKISQNEVCSAAKHLAAERCYTPSEFDIDAFLRIFWQ